MDIFSLDKKKYLVTGASSGIGATICNAIVESKGKVIAFARRKELLKNMQQELGEDNFTFNVVDLLENDELNIALNDIPKIDGVIHAAGIVKPYPVKFIREKNISEIFKLNFEAPVIITSYLLKQKKVNQGGSIVFISSISSHFPYVGGAMYVSSKAALEAYSKSVALEAAPKKIRSNCIAPGLVKTEIFERTLKASSDEHMKAYEEKYPLGYGEPEDVAYSAIFLLSAASRWITGTCINMDGGLTLSSK